MRKFNINIWDKRESQGIFTAVLPRKHKGFSFYKISIISMPPQDEETDWQCFPLKHHRHWRQSLKKLFTPIYKIRHIHYTFLKPFQSN